MRLKRAHALLAGLILATTTSVAVAQEPIPMPGHPAPTHAYPIVDAHPGGCADCAAAPKAKGGLIEGWRTALCEGPCGGLPCDKPFGCTSKCDTKCFMFGSCNQFFGRRDRRPPVYPPPGIIPPWTSPCEYGTWHRW